MRTTWRRAAAVLVTAATTAGLTSAAGQTAAAAPPAQPQGCRLGNGITHVVQIMFDNVHLTRDNPNVASDLEQMPHLLNFLERNGVVMANDHDVLVHTATNFVSNITGLYPDRTAITQSNSGSYYDAAGNTHTDVSFAYWTAPVYDPSGASIDTGYNLRYTADRNDVPNGSDVNVPAPWVPYTRAGCNVGQVGMANTVLENTNIDVATVFGAGSPQAAEAAADPAKAAADYVGLGVHCAAGASLCADGQTDALPSEPGGYTGYRALFGNAEVQPAISPSGPVRALDGSVITDSHGNVGFPGFDSLTATNALGYGAQMLEHGVQVANIYLSDVHSDHTGGTGDFGPGQQGYVQQLHDYDAAFGQFFARLAADGITPANTLFAVTTDEGDHFSGSDPTPAGCTGTPGDYCNYAVRSEVNVNVRGLLATERGDTTAYAIHSDPAPAFWLTGDPSRDDPAVRQFEQNLASLTITNPLTGASDHVAYQLADPVEEKILHFVSSDAARTPTLTAYSGEDEYVTNGAANCSRACVYTSQGYAWNHGGIWPDMQDIWAGYAGPGIRSRGVDDTTWTDQVDMRPTVLALTGLRDDYAVDGRVLTEIAAPAALPRSLRAHHEAVAELGRLYKQILASDGSFAEDTLAASTRALTSSDEDTYAAVETALDALGTRRNDIANRIGAALLGAAFDNKPVDQRQAAVLIAQARALLADAHALAG